MTHSCSWEHVGRSEDARPGHINQVFIWLYEIQDTFCIMLSRSLDMILRCHANAKKQQDIRNKDVNSYLQPANIFYSIDEFIIIMDWQTVCGKYCRPHSI